MLCGNENCASFINYINLTIDLQKINIFDVLINLLTKKYNMKRLLPLVVLAMLTVSAIAQSDAKKESSMIDYRHAENNAGIGTHTPHIVDRASYPVVSGSRALSTVPLGTSGNPYTIIDNTVNSLFFNNVLNTATFIHRTNSKIYLTDDANNGQYRYDVSRDGGASWTIDHGLLTPSGTEGGGPACRYPMGVIHNPAGNTDPDSAYLAYFGSYHTGGSGASWIGDIKGRARLDNAPSTFTEGLFNPPGSLIASSLCERVNGEFWSVDVYTPDDDNITGINVFKGTWNATTKDVDWAVSTVLTPTFDMSTGKGVLTGLCMAWDPSGQYGWIAGTGDIITTGDNVLQPVLYNTTDGGATWNGPIAIDFTAMPDLAYDPIDGPASTGFDIGLSVDVDGNPHMCFVLLPGSTSTAYSVLGGSTNKALYDLTYNSSAPAGCEWKMLKLADVNSFRRTVGTNVSCDNYVRVARTDDGSKLFVTWLDSDPALVGEGGDNDFPELHVLGLNVSTGNKTVVALPSEGDATWGGNVLWPTTAPIVYTTAGNTNLPVVIAQMNAAFDELDTCYFHYVTNINIADAAFTASIDDVPPTMELLGDSVMWIGINTSFNDPGATAFDCFDGDLTSSIVVPNAVDTATLGTYTVMYTVCDAAGNCDTVTRIVIVASRPACTINISHIAGSTLQFSYTSVSPATAQSWRFGDGAGNSSPTPSHTYAVSGTYNVMLTPENAIGKDTCYETVVVDNENHTISWSNGNVDWTAIGNIDLDNSVKIYPNPANNFVQVELNAQAGKVNVQLMNILGESIQSKELSNLNGQSKVNFDLANLSQGVYMIKVDLDGITTVKKLYVK